MSGAAVSQGTTSKWVLPKACCAHENVPSAIAGEHSFGMPPFVLVLDNQEVAALISHIRTSWGNQASAIAPLEVNRIRAGQTR